MTLVKNKSTDENRRFWSHVESVAEQATKWRELTADVSPARASASPEEKRQPESQSPDQS